MVWVRFKMTLEAMELRRSRVSSHWQWTTLLIVALTPVSFACKRSKALPPVYYVPIADTRPVPTRPAPAIALRADVTTVDRGGAITLTWDASNATTVDIQPEVGQVELTGSRKVSPVASVIYIATATGPS